MNTFKKLIYHKSKPQTAIPHSPENQLEVCVCCGKRLNIKKDIPISLRSDYLAGAGQLCSDCYFEVTHPKKD